MSETATATASPQIVQADADLAKVRTELATAREWLPKLTKAAEAYDQGPVDHGMLSGISRNPNPKADARRQARYGREADAYKAVTDCQNRISHLIAREARLVRDYPKPFTLEELKAARAIRTAADGWQKVARVNDKSVSIATGYTWCERIPFGKILDVHL